MTDKDKKIKELLEKGWEVHHKGSQLIKHANDILAVAYSMCEHNEFKYEQVGQFGTDALRTVERCVTCGYTKDLIIENLKKQKPSTCSGTCSCNKSKKRR